MGALIKLTEWLAWPMVVRHEWVPNLRLFQVENAVDQLNLRALPPSWRCESSVKTTPFWSSALCLW